MQAGTPPLIATPPTRVPACSASLYSRDLAERQTVIEKTNELFLRRGLQCKPVPPFRFSRYPRPSAGLLCKPLRGDISRAGAYFFFVLGGAFGAGFPALFGNNAEMYWKTKSAWLP